MSLNSIIELLDSSAETQDGLNNCYDFLCAILDKETERHRPRTKMQQKGSQKKIIVKQPYWNSDLQNMWWNLRLAEKTFLKCKDQILKKRLHKIFKTCQFNFDKKLRLYKRRYRRGKALQLDYLQSNNQQQFWREINKLGPKLKKTIPLEIMAENGESLFQTDQVLNKWEADYRDLFACNSAHQFDDQFLIDICSAKISLEDMNHSLFCCNDLLNRDIAVEEVQKVIGKIKAHKAVGIDGVPNEVLKCPKLLNCLYSLFR